MGVAFGRARPATGFSLDLRGVVTALSPAVLANTILAPAGSAKNLLTKIEALRATGQIVIQALPDAVLDVAELSCDRQLVQVGDDWKIEAINH